MSDARPRPLVDAPVAVLAADAERLAKAWLIELLAAQPLARAAELPVAGIAREGPALCTAAVEALADDVALARLPALPSGLSGPDAVWAAEALRRTLWAALLDELRRPTVAYVSELADRLGTVCATLLAGAAPAWPAALDSRVREGGAFAVCLLELIGRERLLAAEDAGAAIARTERALGELVGPRERLETEAPGRYWVIAADAERAGELAAAADPDGHRGAPLRFAAGVASHPDDGRDARTLIERAEDSLLAALASGV
jgi:hypothetical protein